MFAVPCNVVSRPYDVTGMTNSAYSTAVPARMVGRVEIPPALFSALVTTCQDACDGRLDIDLDVNIRHVANRRSLLRVSAVIINIEMSGSPRACYEFIRYVERRGFCVGHSH